MLNRSVCQQAVFGDWCPKPKVLENSEIWRFEFFCSILSNFQSMETWDVVILFCRCLLDAWKLFSKFLETLFSFFFVFFFWHVALIHFAITKWNRIPSATAVRVGRYEPCPEQCRRRLAVRPTGHFVAEARLGRTSFGDSFSALRQDSRACSRTSARTFLISRCRWKS